MSTEKRVAWRLGRRLGAGVLALVLAEVAARLLTGNGAAAPAPPDGPLRVLALGDTTTFGLEVEPAQTYPAQLERLWVEHHLPLRPIEVINAAVPGTSSATLRRDLPGLLQAFRPDVITVMIGAGDFFLDPDPPRSRPWLERLRLYQLLHRPRADTFYLEFAAPLGFPPIAGSLLVGGERFDLGWTHKADPPDLDWRDVVRENLAAIADAAAEARVGVIFITYPAPAVAFVSDVIRAAARERDVLLADVAAAMYPVCPSSECPELYLERQHPTRLGHEFVAKALLTRLRATPWVVRPQT